MLGQTDYFSVLPMIKLIVFISPNATIGVGKSTLIQGIAGKRIREIEHKTTFSGETATKAVYDAENPLPAFEIGHSKKSKTSSINALVREQATMI